MSEYSGELPPGLCEKGITDEDRIRAIISVIVTGKECITKAPNATNESIKTEGEV